MRAVPTVLAPTTFSFKRQRDRWLKFESEQLSEATFSAAEYWFVSDPVGGLRAVDLREWPGSGRHRNGSGHTPATMPRRGKTWAELSAQVEAVDCKLMAKGLKPLSAAERTACRLFTGPMALKYDALVKYAILPNSEATNACDELCAGNGYLHTLSILHGALKRLALLSTAGDRSGPHPPCSCCAHPLAMVYNTPLMTSLSADPDRRVALPITIFRRSRQDMARGVVQSHVLLGLRHMRR